MRRSALTRAQDTLVAQRLQTPATRANQVRNARAETGRRRRWAVMRDTVCDLLDGWLSAGARVAVLGAGNGDTLPLSQIAGRASHLALIDLDPAALTRARSHLPRGLRARVQTINHDVTDGCANQISVRAAADAMPAPLRLTETPLPGAPYDLVIGDLFYSQLLYPALMDLGIPAARSNPVLDRYGPQLTRGVVRRMHVSAPDGRVLHLHDPCAWWPGHPQPTTLNHILHAAQSDPAAALKLIAHSPGPHYSDPRPALQHLGIPIRETRWWKWPFAPHIDYLICATLAGAPPQSSAL